MVEEATTNLETNPSMALGDPPTGYDDYNTPTRSQTSDYAKYGTYSQKVIADAANDGVSDTIAADASEDYTFSVWVRADTNTTIYLHLVDQDDNSLVAATPHTVGGTFQKFVLSAATGVGDTGIKGIVYASEACTFYIDGYQMEKLAYPTSTCIGSFSWCAWSGADDASASTRAATEVNLDAYASLLSDNDTWSLSLWWQPQYDADAAWPPNYMFDLLGGNNNNRILFNFDPADNKIKVYINGGWRLESAAQTFEAGDQQHILITFDFATDAYILYINGVEVASDATVLTAPTALAQMNLGTDTAGGSVPNATYSELAIIDSVLTAADAAAMFQLGNPLTDQGATQTPSLAGRTLSVGDGANYSHIEEDGTLVFNGDATVWNDVNLGAAMLSKPAASQPDEDEFKDSTGADTGIFTLAFAPTELVSGSIEIPHSYKEGSDFVFHVHWQGILAPTETDKLKWQLTYFVSSADAVVPVPTTIVIETDFDTQYEAKKSDFPTISGAGIALEDQFCFSLSRIAASADEYTGDALVMNVGLHFEEDTVGSRTISTR